MKSKKICTCFSCGYSNAIVDDSKILESYPPKYNYHCPKCDYDGCVVTNEVYEVTEPLEKINIIDIKQDGKSLIDDDTKIDLNDIVKPYIPYDPNNQVTLYQLPVWKTYKDEESNEQLIINLCDVKYLKSYKTRVEVLEDDFIEYWRYFVYIKIQEAETDEIEITESIYNQIIRDLEMGE